MRSASLVLGAPALVVLGVACSGGGSSAGGPDTTANPIAFEYAPSGCGYTYAVPASRGFQDIALDDGQPVDVASSAPQRVRVGLGGGTTKGQPGYADPTTSAAFVWQTAGASHAAAVRFGTAPGALAQTARGYVWTTPKGLANATDTSMHEVHVCGLTPGTTYFYQVGGGAPGADAWSATQSFTTVPAAGTITLGVFGDARDEVATWQAVHVRMRDAGVAMQLFSGDMVFSGSSEALFAQWLDAIWHDPSDGAKFLTLGQQMMVPIAGNHENDAADFYANFALPGDGPYAETYASFDIGSAHFALVDDQQIGESLAGGSPTDETNAQLAWLDRDLAAANADRANHPFVVVINHRSLFSTSMHANDADVLAARGALAPLFDKYAVDLVVNGHEHEYERSKPLKAGTPASGAPVVGRGTTYVVVAGAGADPYAVNQTTADYNALSVAYGPMTSYIGIYSLLQLSPHGLTLTAYGLKASSMTVAGDDVIDKVTMTR
jgi:hypothetical protein